MYIFIILYNSLFPVCEGEMSESFTHGKWKGNEK